MNQMSERSLRALPDGVRRRLGVLSLAVCGLALLFCSVAAADNGLLYPDGAGVIPDTRGAIAAVRLHYEPNVDEELQPFYQDLFAELPSDTAVTVLCPDQESAGRFLASWGSSVSIGGRDLTVINVGGDLTLWARDRYLARQWGNLSLPATAYIPLPDPYYDIPQLNELAVQMELAVVSTEPLVDEAPFFFEGGNIVSNGHQVFVGMNVLAENAPKYRGLTPGALRTIAGRPLIFVRDANDDVPWCHVDMYMTPIGEDAVLVADVARGEALSDEAAALVDAECEAERSPVVTSEYVQQQLDDVARLMARSGYRVYRVPAIVDPFGDWMVTYNNVLMEERGGQRIVYLPMYRMPELDIEAALIYRRLGFEVKYIDVSELYLWGGALRCMVNVTQRRDVVARPDPPTLRRVGSIAYFDLVEPFDPIESAEPLCDEELIVPATPR
jgi:hypothetical protein